MLSFSELEELLLESEKAEAARLNKAIVHDEYETPGDRILDIQDLRTLHEVIARKEAK